jgi:hypothetical protein
MSQFLRVTLSAALTVVAVASQSAEADSGRQGMYFAKRACTGSPLPSFA